MRTPGRRAWLSHSFTTLRPADQFRSRRRSAIFGRLSRSRNSKYRTKKMVLEGPAFDRDGNLLFCDVSESRVLRLTPDKHLSVVVSEKRVSPGGIAIHKDGRIFIAAINLVERSSDIIAVRPDGTDRQSIVPLEA